MINKSPAASMAMFITANLLVNTFALNVDNGSVYDDSTWINDAPEILEFGFNPNPVVEGQNVNVTCRVRPVDAQVLITRIRRDDLSHSQDYSSYITNDTISIYGADQSGVLWGNVPFNQSGAYICEARNFRGLVRSRSVNLFLRYLPQSHVVVELNTTVGLSMNVNLVHPARCYVTSEKEPIEYLWDYVPAANGSSWITLPKKAGSINVSADTSGIYRCSGLTDLGWSAWSTPVKITPSTASTMTSHSISLFITLLLCMSF